MNLRRIYVIGIFVLLSMFLALSNLGSKSVYANAVRPANDTDLTTSEVDASKLPNQLFLPALADESGGALENFATISDISGTVEMCYNGTENGREIDAALPGQPSIRLFSGVLNVTVDGTEHKAFCIDFHNGISNGCFANSTVEAADPLVACTLQYFPPEAGLPLDEAAARQATVWHFSDGLETSGPSAVKSLTDEYIAFVLARQAAGQCDASLTPTLTIDPSSAVNFLLPDGSDGYLSSLHEYSIQLKKGALPIANESVTVTTNLGTLTSGAVTGTTVQVTTDANGEAKVTIAYDAPGTATIVATTVVALPAGIRLDAGVDIQKLGIPGTDSFPLEATATKQWEPGGTVVVRKFHDRDRNGLYNNPPDELIDWQIRYRQQDGNDFTGGGWTDLALGADGTETIGVQLGANYQFCEVTQADWVSTTPVCFGGITAGSVVSFGNVHLPGLLITKYHDLNGNGTRDSGEPGLDGWQFSIRRFENNTWIASYAGQTNASGNLAFADVAYPFDYQAIESMQSGWYSSTSTVQSVAITEQGLYTLTFGNLQPGSLVLNKTWYSNTTQINGTQPATICLQRNPAAPAHTSVPTVNGTPLTLTGGQYCTPVVDTVTVENLWPGSYTISETPLAGWSVDVASQNRSIVSGGSNTVTFRNDQVQQVPASLGDYVWNDTNQNGVQDSGEIPVAGVTVTLSTVCGGAVLATQVTDANGKYLFDNLQPGDYVVHFELPAGYVFTGADQGGNDATDSDANVITGCTPVINLSAGENDLTWDAGIYQPLASLGDYVWNDTNQNGVQDSGEIPVAGVTVTLSTVCGGAVLATQVTDANGKYLFDNLQPGDYVVHFELPAGYVFTGADQGGNDATDSDANVITGCTPVINLSAGENDLTWDAGIYQPPIQPLLGALGDTVWFDENKNGIQDVGEEGVPNVKVDLYSADDTFLKTDTTDADGKYLFTDLPAGSYYVTFADVAGYNFTLYDADDNAQDAEDSDPLVPVVALSVSTAEEEGVLGQDLAYTFIYTNTDSSRNAVDVVISTTVPVGSVFQPAASNAAWQCTSAEAGGVCTLSIDQLAPNASGSALFVVKLKNTVGEVPDPLNLVVSLTEGTSAQTEVVDLGAGETNLTVDAGLVRNQTTLQTATSTGPTGLPGEEQPGHDMIFMPAIQS